MTGHFEKGKWIDNGFVVISLTTPFMEQVERLAKLLDLKPSKFPPATGIGVQGLDDHWFDFLEMLEMILKRVK